MLLAFIIVIWLIIASPWIGGSIVVGCIASGLVKDELPRPVGSAVIGEMALVASVFVTLMLANAPLERSVGLAISTGVVAIPVFLAVALITWAVGSARRGQAARQPELGWAE
jgi:hypothetical protein